MKLKLKKKEIIGLLAILILLAVLPAAILLVKTRLEIRPKATMGEVGLALVPSKGDYTLGEEFTVEVKITQEEPTQPPGEPTFTPTPPPGEPTSTPTPVSGEPTATPSQGEPTSTPTPTSPSGTWVAKTYTSCTDTCLAQESTCVDACTLPYCEQPSGRYSPTNQACYTGTMGCLPVTDEGGFCCCGTSTAPTTTPTPPKDERPTATPTPEPICFENFIGTAPCSIGNYHYGDYIYNETDEIYGSRNTQCYVGSWQEPIGEYRTVVSCTDRYLVPKGTLWIKSCTTVPGGIPPYPTFYGTSEWTLCGPSTPALTPTPSPTPYWPEYRFYACVQQPEGYSWCQGVYSCPPLHDCYESEDACRNNCGQTQGVVAQAQEQDYGFSISAAQIGLNFDPSVLEVKDVSIDNRTTCSDTVESDCSDLVLKDIKNDEGKLKFAIAEKRATEDLPRGTFTLAKVTFKGKGEGTSSATFSDLQIVGFNDQSDNVELTVSQKLEGSYTIGGVSPDTPWLKFSLKFQGLSSEYLQIDEDERQEIEIKLRVVDKTKYPDQVFDFEGIDASVSDQLILTPKNEWVPLPGATAGPGFNILLKGPKHLQKRVLENVTLYAGKDSRNGYSVITTPLEPGDLPDPKNNFQQDGVVNGNDVSLLLDRIGKSIDDDEEAVRVADLSYDNVVNTHDRSLMIETLETKYEDEE